MNNFLNALHETGGNILVTKYIRNVTKLRTDINFAEAYGDLRYSDLLNASFNWSFSPEGHKYWSYFCNILYERYNPLKVNNTEVDLILNYYKQNPQLKEIIN